MSSNGDVVIVAHKDQWKNYKSPLDEQEYASEVKYDVGIEPSGEELNDLSKALNKLWELGLNRLVLGKDYQIDCGEGKKFYQKEDMAGGSLFSWLSEEIFMRPIFAHFCSLLDNYNTHEGYKENVTPEERQEQAAYIEEISRTAPIKYLHKYLSSNGIFYLEEAKGRVNYQAYILPRRRGPIVKQLYVTRDSSDYLWYMTNVNIASNKGLLKSGQWPLLSIMFAGHALHVFINGKLSGTTYGSLDNPKLTFSNYVNLRAGVNKISLLSVAGELRDIEGNMLVTSFPPIKIKKDEDSRSGGGDQGNAGS
ncbi:unnamed protein product [Fraxinus pennsylvanica]|uniref:EndoU domain-containing protein n=1 Tax=Fraxinus pennsylvanica TaxID=56036 RepID=A0AAD1ZJY3_9LAMI|nr:unnamed protein product [Fraxinus pennsylvanica]